MDIHTDLSRNLGLTSTLAIGVGPVIMVKNYHPVKELLGRVVGE